jgi:hypothetical protein
MRPGEYAAETLRVCIEDHDFTRAGVGDTRIRISELAVMLQIATELREIRFALETIAGADPNREHGS